MEYPSSVIYFLLSNLIFLIKTCSCKKVCLGVANLPHQPWFLWYTPTGCKFSYLFQDMASPYQVVQNNMGTGEYKTEMIVVYLWQCEKYPCF